MRALALLPLALVSVAQATPINMVYQARVLDTQGTPITGPLTLTVGIYSSSDTSELAPPALWSDQMDVTVTDGFVTLTLGRDGNPLQDTYFDGSARYVGLSVGSDAIGDRQLLTTVPAAVTANNVVGGTVQASTVRIGSDTDTCSDSSPAGTMRWEASTNEMLVCTGTDWRPVLLDGPPASCAEVKLRDQTATSQVYELEPGEGPTLQVYCDMSGSTPKALLMRIAGAGRQHVDNNGRYGDYPCLPSSTECKLSTAEISRFIANDGVQVFEVDPQGGSFISFYQRAASDTQVWPSDLEASSRPSILASATTSWILTSYQTYANATAGTGGDTGDYEGANHHYPTPYSNQQLFFKGSGTGMRANTAWSSSCCNDDEPGYLWVY